jgi:hypothetical protein
MNVDASGGVLDEEIAQMLIGVRDDAGQLYPESPVCLLRRQVPDRARRR